MKNLLSEKRVCVISPIGDTFLALVKMIIGKAAGSSALFSDGLHSCTDAVTSVVTFLGAASKKDGSESKAEKRTVGFICTVMLLTGILMLVNSARGIIFGLYEVPPSASALYVSVFAVIIKEAMFLISLYASKKTESVILYAQAWHHQSDALSSICGFIGIIGSNIGIAAADKAAGIVISILIIKTAFDIRRKNK